MSIASRQRQVEQRRAVIRNARLMGFDSWQHLWTAQRQLRAKWVDTPQIVEARKTELVLNAYGLPSSPPRLFATAFDGPMVPMTFPESDLETNAEFLVLSQIEENASVDVERHQE